ncbi:MAG: hypothetical protein V2I27_02950 [Erythrobacter sp.]|jgi:hypothetical protein|nr:hypothetical protein [Erythrobacter sp.]
MATRNPAVRQRKQRREGDGNAQNRDEQIGHGHSLRKCSLCVPIALFTTCSALSTAISVLVRAFQKVLDLFRLHGYGRSLS